MFSRWIQIDTSKSILLIGPRRSGKTTYLKSNFPNATYTTLDDWDAYEWAKQDPKAFITQLGPQAIIDEIQRLPNLTIAVKYAIDEETATFYMTGSSNIGLLDVSAESLAGRIQIIHFPTACWGEDEGPPLKESLTDPHSFPALKEAQRSLPSALKFGGFPEVLSQPDEKTKLQALQNYKNTYFTRDLMQLANLENAEGILALYHYLIRSLGSHIEVQNVARECGLSAPTAKKYLNALVQSGLTFKLYGYQYGPAKRFIKASKTYFADNGILTSFNQSLSQGQLVENFVISELEKRRKLGFIQADSLYYYKSISGREIDVLYTENNRLHAIEIKATSTPTPKDIRNLKEFAAHHDKPCKLILFYMGTTYQEQAGVNLIPIASLYRSRG